MNFFFGTIVEMKAVVEKTSVNRKLILWVFVLTGIFSGFVWWRGRVIKETPPEILDNPMSGVTPTQTIVKNGVDNWGQVEEANLMEQISRETATQSGRYAVYVYRLDDKYGYGLNEDERMPAASIMKIPAMLTVMSEIDRGGLELTDKYVLDEADRATGSGPLQFREAGTSYTIDVLLNYLGKNSDNTAWVMFNRRLGKAKIREMMKTMKLENSSYDDLVVSARDAAKMFEYIDDGLVGGEAGREKIFGYLIDSIYEDRIPAAFTDEDRVKIIHKVGTDAGVWADVGIVECESGTNCGVGPFVVAVLNQDVKRSEALTMVPSIVRRIWNFEVNRAKKR